MGDDALRRTLEAVRDRSPETRVFCATSSAESCATNTGALVLVLPGRFAASSLPHGGTEPGSVVA